MKLYKITASGYEICTVFQDEIRLNTTSVSIGKYFKESHEIRDYESEDEAYEAAGHRIDLLLKAGFSKECPFEDKTVESLDFNNGKNLILSISSNGSYNEIAAISTTYPKWKEVTKAVLMFIDISKKPRKDIFSSIEMPDEIVIV